MFKISLWKQYQSYISEIKNRFKISLGSIVFYLNLNMVQLFGYSDIQDVKYHLVFKAQPVPKLYFHCVYILPHLSTIFEEYSDILAIFISVWYQLKI